MNQISRVRSAPLFAVAVATTLVVGCAPATKQGDASAPAPAVDGSGTGIPAGQARAALVAGNRRFLDGGMRAHAWQNERVAQTGQYGQSPSVGILSCADSRVPVELIFDQGVGDLFVVRMAGNFDTPGATATFEYGVAALGVHTLLVLGHTKCGAVAAAVDGKDLPGSMPIFVREIRPAIEQAIAGRKGQPAEAILNAAIEVNVRQQMRKLEESAILRDAKAKGVQVLGAVYDVDTGTVRFLD
jgi:carbonic anhydrase